MRRKTRVARRARSIARPLAGVIGLGATLGMLAAPTSVAADRYAPQASVVTAWESDRSTNRSLPSPHDEPAEIAGFFAATPPAELRRLVRTHPEIVGALDGAPIGARYAANRRLSEESAPASVETEAAIRDHELLLFDPRERGRIAVVLGDMDTAEHITVLVPGSDVDLARFAEAESPLRKPMGKATALHAELTAAHPTKQTAVIAWLGYQTPEGLGLDAISGSLARQGGAELADFVDGLRVQLPGRQISLICHSYGAVVCGQAALVTSAVDDLVLLAAPGVRVDSVDELHTRARVWAGRADEDWITHIPGWRIGDLGHGPDPTAADFGARILPTEDVTAHDDYFAPGTDSLAAVAEVVVGSHIGPQAESPAAGAAQHRETNR
ncbi:alpha/beta hydrolase [Actinoalloteichus hymeniacidonis]|uniref:Alpha/beta hydrolase n=1 Tax=Actinoalloteichus hymeniacidonis TaxID=340345 RepID=A0AAC9HTV7_9PSEU|nr:alpha/beta hydrolase [Actinoalloteichus hymeniacidonis]AOS64400.1 Alpha/beta hydrolase [Actinoalloteichus hymeniacidonis]MBB5907532.1 hypothetical protein [Actinoalloteichus hymeniacidonis]